jgi:hypothetical protein
MRFAGEAELTVRPSLLTGVPFGHRPSLAPNARLTGNTYFSDLVRRRSYDVVTPPRLPTRTPRAKMAREKMSEGFPSSQSASATRGAASSFG